MNLNQIEKKKRYQKQKRIIEEAKALVAFEQLWADVGDKHLCLDDIEEVVKAEIGIEMTEDTIFQTDKKGNKKLLWSNEDT